MSEVQITEDTTKADARKVNSGKRYPKEVKDEVIAFIKSKAVEVDGKYIVPRGTYKQGYAKFGMSYLTQTKLFRKAYPNV